MNTRLNTLYICQNEKLVLLLVSEKNDVELDVSEKIVLLLNFIQEKEYNIPHISDHLLRKYIFRPFDATLKFCLWHNDVHLTVNSRLA